MFAKWMASIILLFTGLISMPELFFRRIILDKFDERAWCVLTLNNDQPGLLALYSALNIRSLINPLAINLTSAVIIIRVTLQSKQKTNRQQHKYILINPILLSIISLAKVILNFVFLCTKFDQSSIPNLIAYLVAFLPTMAMPIAYIWPSAIYRTALIKGLKKIVPKFLLNLRAYRK